MCFHICKWYTPYFSFVFCVWILILLNWENVVKIIAIWKKNPINGQKNTCEWLSSLEMLSFVYFNKRSAFHMWIGLHVIQNWIVDAISFEYSSFFSLFFAFFFHIKQTYPKHMAVNHIFYVVGWTQHACIGECCVLCLDYKMVCTQKPKRSHRK